MPKGVYKHKLHTQEWKDRMSKLLKGKSPYKITDEIRKKISVATKIATPRGDSVHNWKGDSVSYRGLHFWVIRIKGKARFCSNYIRCKMISDRYHWANLSGKYLRDASDYISLCASCHRLFDSGKIAITI